MEVLFLFRFSDTCHIISMTNLLQTFFYCSKCHENTETLTLFSFMDSVPNGSAAATKNEYHLRFPILRCPNARTIS